MSRQSTPERTISGSTSHSIISISCRGKRTRRKIDEVVQWKRVELFRVRGSTYHLHHNSWPFLKQIIAEFCCRNFSPVYFAIYPITESVYMHLLRYTLFPTATFQSCESKIVSYVIERKRSISITNTCIDWIIPPPHCSIYLSHLRVPFIVRRIWFKRKDANVSVVAKLFRSKLIHKDSTCNEGSWKGGCFVEEPSMHADI
mmetsp:Transcript_4237/g.9461  ORF Transcript_4237/g.9461 Transcript_4237/m.9461 type:complete len:201 (+) Transcript_4237:316-918(+)